MAKKQLFEDAEALINGYGLSAKRGTRKVFLVGRPLRSGNVSLVRYACNGGVRKRVSTGVVLKVEANTAIKKDNEELLRLQNIECDTLNADLERREANFAPLPKTKILLADYIAQQRDEALKESGNRHSNYASLNALLKHVEVYDKEAKIGNVDLEWVYGFLYYLRHDALNMNYQRTEKAGRRKEIKLSQNTQCRLLRNLSYVLNKAVKAHVMAENPIGNLNKSDKISAKTGTRTYLTKEEVQLLVSVPYGGVRDIKAAFLFSCFTGLRYSDLQRITLADFHKDTIGTYLDISMVKTGERLRVYVPDNALRMIPKRERSNTEPIFNLPKNDYANVCLRKWVESAGIDKTITFHCARHTAATLLLSSGLPLAIVSKQLGHLKISTTQIYAKIVDEAQVEAANIMDKIINI